MEFCPKCGGMILPQEVGEEDDKQIVLPIFQIMIQMMI